MHNATMKTSLHSMLLAAVVMIAVPAHAAQQCLVIGDSLTKEYEVEFPVLYPENSDAWKARNWIETLHKVRTNWFDLGHFSVFPDYRITGHQYNWAFPGATTQEIREKLLSTSWFDKQWQNELKSQIRGEVERVVILAGGNDVDSYYDQLYNGKTTATASLNRTRDNLIRIVDWVRSVRSTVPIVLVAIPHVGCAPDVQREFPTNGTKTGRVSTLLATTNTQLAALSKSRGVAFASGVFDFTRNLITQRLIIDGVEILRQADDDCRPNYGFSGDGFHPNTALQAKIAQIIVNTIRAKWPSPVIPAITDNEIRVKVLGL